MEIGKLEINHLYRSHCKYYANKLKEAKRDTSKGSRIGYIWAKKKEKIIPNFEYIENILKWKGKNINYNFNSTYVGKGYYYWNNDDSSSSEDEDE